MKYYFELNNSLRIYKLMIIDTSGTSTPLSQKSPIFQLSKTKTEISSLITEINSHIFRDKYFIDEEHTILDLLKKLLV